MPRDYDRDYTSEDTSDYKRKRRSDEENIKNDQVDGDEAQQTAAQHDAPPLNEKTAAYLEECVQEKNLLDSNKYNICKKLLDDGKFVMKCNFPRYNFTQSHHFGFVKIVKMCVCACI